MSIYGRVFAAGYDKFMAGTENAGLRAHREALLANVGGRVVEIGGGTGANLPLYGSTVEDLVVTEPEEPMARRLEQKLGSCKVPVRVVRASAESLPFPDGSFDVAISSLVLCTVGNPAQALKEIRRVLKPSGRLVFLEHVRSDNARLARWQDRLNGIQNRIGHGCNCNRDTLSSIRAAGFTIAELEHDQLPKAPPFIRPLIMGDAARD